MKSEKWVILLLLLSLFPLCWGLGSFGLFEPEETRFAEMAKEMRLTGDWLVPRMAGIPILEKPPLTAWLTAISFEFFGETEFAARLVSVLAALLSLYFTFKIGKLLGGERLGFLGALILACTPLFWGMGRILNSDTPFSTAIIAAVYFLFSLHKKSSWVASLGLGLATSAAVLCKGPIGLVLIAFAGISFCLVDRSLRPARAFLHPAGILLFFVLTLPWFIFITKKYPSFLNYYFLDQHLSRFLGSDPEAKDFHPEGFHYFIPVLIGGLFPWIVFLPSAFRAGWKSFVGSIDFQGRRVLWVWAVIVFLFFSLGSGKRIPYLVPIWPAIALGLAAFFIERMDGEPGIAKTLSRYWAILFLLIPIPFFLPEGTRADEYLDRLHLQRLSFVVASGVGILGVFLLLNSSRLKEAVACIVLWICGLFMIGISVIPNVEEDFSMRKIAKKAASFAGGDTLLLSYPRYRPGLSFYSGCQVFINGLPNELDYGLDLEPGMWVYFVTDRFEQQLLTRPNSFVLVGSESHIRRNLELWNDFGPVYVIDEGMKWDIVRN